MTRILVLGAALGLAWASPLPAASDTGRQQDRVARTIYGHVSHLGWVVRDLDAIVAPSPHA